MSTNEPNYLTTLPPSPHTAQRLANVHPAEWVNPIAAATYNLVVIGGGSAGLVTAIVTAGLGGKVALIEKNLMGGDCLNVGCVPSKALLRAAKAAHEMRTAAAYGIDSADPQIHFDQVMERVRRVQAEISPVDSVWRYTKEGVDVFLGEGHFTGANSIEVAGQRLQFKKAVIATGSRPAHSSIPGLAEAGFLTNETVWNLPQQPKRLAIIGGGPIGCELAQAFQRLGTEVILLHNGDQLLPREDAEAATLLQQSLQREGVKLLLGSNVIQVSQVDGDKVLQYESAQVHNTVTVDEILVATGRRPNIEQMNLTAAGVESDAKQGIVVNDYLQSTNPHIYAAGDVAMAYKFTHAASASAKLVVQNALFYGRKKVSDLKMPWCTYTDPEIAHVGLSAQEAADKGIAIDTYTVHLDENDRAMTDGETDGFVKVHTKRKSDTILGATIVARHAGELINEITLAMVAGRGLQTLGNVIHPYPTQAEAIARVAGLYTRSRLTPTAHKLAKGWMWLRRAGRS